MLDIRIGHRDRIQEPERVGMRRALVHVAAAPYLDQLAQVHHADLVGQVPDHRQVVRDHDVREPVSGLQPPHEVEDLGADRDVEGRDRLVGHDELGREREGTGQADPLPLAAGELVRVQLHRSRAQAHLVEQVGDALPLLGPAPQALNLQRLPQDRAHPHPRVEGRVRILEHELEILADLPQARAREAAEVLSFEDHPS